MRPAADRLVWVAQYDPSRPLKPWREVEPLVQERHGPGSRYGARSNGFRLRDLFRNFNLGQDRRLSAAEVLIVDETGIPEDLPVSRIVVDWYCEHGPQVAREWFAREFGITFIEEVRPMTVYEVRERSR